MENWRRNPLAFAAISMPPAFWLLVFFLIPLGIVWFYSFGENVDLVTIKTTWTLENSQRAGEPELFTLFVRSLWLASVATLVCLVVGFPIALVITTSSPKWKSWLLLLIILPFWTNLLIRTYALLNILGSRGRINEALHWLWDLGDGFLVIIGLGELNLLGERFTPLTLLGNNFGVIFGLVYVALPFTVLPLYSALERMDRSYIEASLDLGASQLRTFFSVIIPLASSGIVSALIITFIPTLGSFLTPDLLGRGQVDMIANVIERQFKSANDWPFGSALSFILLYATFFALAARSLLAGRGGRDDAEAF